MDDIFDMLVEAIDERSFEYVSPKVEHRREVNCAEQHLQWLESHLNDEEMAHVQQLRDAELRISTLECKASVKIALAAGIRLALPC